MNQHVFFRRSLVFSKEIFFLPVFFLFFFATIPTNAQQVTLTPDQVKAITPEWKGERSTDGRPHVSDLTLDRLKHISTEEAWGILRSKGYQNQYEGDWMVEHADSPMTGRVVTAQYF